MVTVPARSLARFLALNRTVAVVLLAVLFFGLGEQLWEPFLPVYLAAVKEEVKREVIAGTVSSGILWTVALYACLRQLFEAVCYISGGQLTARLGDRGSLLLFGALSVTGYLLFLLSPTPFVAIVAALLILGWEPLAVPVTFTTVGSTVERKNQGMAFALQSIQKRLPKILGPLIAGEILALAERHATSAEAGRIAGTQALILVALGLGIVSLLLQFAWMPRRSPAPGGAPAWAVFLSLPRELKALWTAEAFTRWCDQLVREFVPIYLVIARHVPVQHVGRLMALQHLVALLTYLPVGRWTRSVGLQPFIGVTFVFFALFPLALVLAPDGWGLVLAFVVYGLREIGEPARKAMITSLMPQDVRARGVGLYWGLRSVAIAPAALVGATLWIGLGQQMPFFVAFGSGCVGAGVFYFLVRRWSTEQSAPSTNTV